MTENRQSAWELRDQMDKQLHQMITTHPNPGPWQEGYPATSLMLNSASHDNDKEAIRLLAEDMVRAHQRGAPLDVVQFALGQVYEFRQIYARKDKQTTEKALKNNLKGKLPKEYLQGIFP